MELIKKLRSLTGAGMIDCKKALEEANNDLEKASEILRKKGISKAAKRTDRETKEGVIKVAVNDDQTEGYILELDSETDFVSRNDKFQSFAGSILSLIQKERPADLEALLTLSYEGQTVADSLANLSGTVGEKMVLKRFSIVRGNTVAAYSHLGGRLGVLVALDTANKVELALDIAMQVAAANPKYLDPSEVDPNEINREKDIYKEQLLKEGKPGSIIDKIIQGKINKYYSEVCLIEQEYIKDDKKKVKDILAGSNILKFVRYSL